jgi:hypothetical protein
LVFARVDKIDKVVLLAVVVVQDLEVQAPVKQVFPLPIRKDSLHRIMPVADVAAQAVVAVPEVAAGQVVLVKRRRVNVVTKQIYKHSKIR